MAFGLFLQCIKNFKADTSWSRFMSKWKMVQTSSQFIATALSCRQRRCVSNKAHLGINSIEINNSVLSALKSKKPVVALESTIITHGMPYPKNIQTALEVEEIIRQNGAIPATVGIINGKIHVGSESGLIEKLSQKKNVHKISRRDLAVALSKCLSGGTTVSATMLIAKWCGIKVFVTGGIGGVHREGETSMDISADLRELGRTPVMVISAGIKSILDIRRTLEYLETEGVTVATFGESKDFPAFFTTSSGCPSPYNVADINEAAAMLDAHSKLNMDSGMLLAVPIPSKHAEMGNAISNAIDKALKESKAKNVAGKEVTPFVLRRVNELTSGLSLKANISLIKNNAEIGAKVAKAYSELSQKTSNFCGKRHNSKSENVPVIIGGSNFDVVSKSIDKLLFDGASNPATVRQTLGGVGRNMTEVLWRLNTDPFFISAVGCDYHGKTLLDEMKEQDTSGILSVEDSRTGVYNVVFDADGEVFVAVMDGDIHSRVTPEHIMNQQERIIRSPLVCVDANISKDAMRCVCSLCSRYEVPLLYEPTGVLIAAKGYLAKSPFDHAITYMTPSLSELIAIYESVTGEETRLSNIGDTPHCCDKNFFNELINICKALLPYTPCILVTLGSQGVFAAYSSGGNYRYTHYPIGPMPGWPWLQDEVGNVSGSGDSFAAGFAFGILRHNSDIDKAVRIGITVAQRTLRSYRSVSIDITEKDAEIQTGDWDGARIMPK